MWTSFPAIDCIAESSRTWAYLSVGVAGISSASASCNQLATAPPLHRANQPYNSAGVWHICAYPCPSCDRAVSGTQSHCARAASIPSGARRDYRSRRPAARRRSRHLPPCATLVVHPGDWLSGRALRSHRRGHWFDPSIAHPVQRPVPRVGIGLLHADHSRHASMRQPGGIVS
jgi:hypothetical protein